MNNKQTFYIIATLAFFCVVFAGILVGISLSEQDTQEIEENSVFSPELPNQEEVEVEKKEVTSTYVPPKRPKTRYWHALTSSSFWWLEVQDVESEDEYFIAPYRLVVSEEGKDDYEFDFDVYSAFHDRPFVGYRGIEDSNIFALVGGIGDACILFAYQRFVNIDNKKSIYVGDSFDKCRNEWDPRKLSFSYTGDRDDLTQLYVHFSTSSADIEHEVVFTVHGLMLNDRPIALRDGDVVYQSRYGEPSFRLVGFNTEFTVMYVDMYYYEYSDDSERIETILGQFAFYPNSKRIQPIGDPYTNDIIMNTGTPYGISATTTESDTLFNLFLKETNNSTN